MNKLKNVLICGLGGVGCVCASNIFNSKKYNLKVLVDNTRYEKYKNNPTIINTRPYVFDIITPETTDFKADFIIIATKNDGLDFAINAVKNFVHKDTIFLSLLNGIHSEEKIAQYYGWGNTLISFYIGHSCIRNDREITLPNNYKFVIGDKINSKSDNVKLISELFDNSQIKYEISNNILDEYWKKFMINVGVNQLSAVTGKKLSEIRQNSILVQQMKNIMFEASEVAKYSGIRKYNELYNSAVDFLLYELEEATPSMLQDIKSNRKTEVDIFAGEIIRLAKIYNIKSVENEKIYKTIKNLEQNT